MILPPSALPVVGVKDMNPGTLKTTGELVNMASPAGVMTRTVYDPAGTGPNVHPIEAVILDILVISQGYIPTVTFTGRGGKLLLKRSPMLEPSLKEFGNIA